MFRWFSTIALTLSLGGMLSVSSPRFGTQSSIGVDLAVFEPLGPAAGGFQILSFDQDGVRVFEQAIAASKPIQRGRVFARVDGPAATGVALANLDSEPATVWFHLTDASGAILRSGSLELAPRERYSAFIHEGPFDAPDGFQGTLTFESSVPLVAVAAEGLTNERGEFIPATIPVLEIPQEPARSRAIVPHFVSGGDWSTRIILTNPIAHPISGTLHALDRDGNDLRPALGQTLRYVVAGASSASVEIDLGADRSVSGTIRVEPDGGMDAPHAVALLSNRVNGVTVSRTTVPATRPSRSWQVYAQASEPDSAGVAVQTGFATSNPGPTHQPVTLTVVDPAGAVVESRTITLAPGGQFSGLLREVFPGLPLNFQGRIGITSTSPVTATGMRGRWTRRADYLVSMLPAIAVAPAGAGGPAAPLIFPQVINGGGYSTEFVLFGESAERPVSGTLRPSHGPDLLAGLGDDVPPIPGLAATGGKPAADALIRDAKAAQVSSPFLYNFNQDGLLQEAANRNRSSSPYWWLSSGGYFRAEDGRGWTNRGALPAGDPWRQRYASSNPVDTDNGYHPQNIFRMSTRSVWRNLRQEVYFVVTGDSYSASPNRNASNGLLFFNRYQDADSLYYTGVRVDGSAVIKKKVNGTYYTMAYVSGIYPGTYDRELNPSLLPKYTWIGLRSEVVDLPGGSVQVKLYLDRGWQGSWELVATAIDDGTQYGPVIRDSGYAGIRTDFMDVLFENYRLRTIP